MFLDGPAFDVLGPKRPRGKNLQAQRVGVMVNARLVAGQHGDHAGPATGRPAFPVARPGAAGQQRITVLDPETRPPQRRLGRLQAVGSEHQGLEARPLAGPAEQPRVARIGINGESDFVEPLVSLPQRAATSVTIAQRRQLAVRQQQPERRVEHLLERPPVGEGLAIEIAAQRTSVANQFGRSHQAVQRREMVKRARLVAQAVVARRADQHLAEVPRAGQRLVDPVLTLQRQADGQQTPLVPYHVVVVRHAGQQGIAQPLPGRHSNRLRAGTQRPAQAPALAVFQTVTQARVNFGHRVAHAGVCHPAVIVRDVVLEAVGNVQRPRPGRLKKTFVAEDRPGSKQRQGIGHQATGRSDIIMKGHVGLAVTAIRIDVVPRAVELRQQVIAALQSLGLLAEPLGRRPPLWLDDALPRTLKLVAAYVQKLPRHCRLLPVLALERRRERIRRATTCPGDGCTKRRLIPVLFQPVKANSASYAELTGNDLEPQPIATGCTAATGEA